MTTEEMQDAMAGQDEVAVERALDTLFADVETFKLFTREDGRREVAIRLGGTDYTTVQGVDDETTGEFINGALLQLRRLNETREPRYCWETPTGVNYFKAGQRYNELRLSLDTADKAEWAALQDVMNRAYEMAE